MALSLSTPPWRRTICRLCAVSPPDVSQCEQQLPDPSPATITSLIVSQSLLLSNTPTFETPKPVAHFLTSWPIWTHRLLGFPFSLFNVWISFDKKKSNISIKIATNEAFILCHFEACCLVNLNWIINLLTLLSLLVCSHAHHQYFYSFCHQ